MICEGCGGPLGEADRCWHCAIIRVPKRLWEHPTTYVKPMVGRSKINRSIATAIQARS